MSDTVDIPFFKYYFQLQATGEIFSLESSYGDVKRVLSGVNVDPRLRHLYEGGGLKLVKDEMHSIVTVKLERVFADIVVERAVELKPAPEKIIVYGDLAGVEPAPVASKTRKPKKKKD